MPHRWRKQLTKTAQKKWSFPLTISLANVTKSTISCGFGLISEEILNGKLHFLCSVSCTANQLIGFYMLGALALNGLTQHFTHSLRGSLKEISGISIKKTSQMQVSFQIEGVSENYWTGLLQYVFKKLLHSVNSLLL